MEAGQLMGHLVITAIFFILVYFMIQYSSACSDLSWWMLLPLLWVWVGNNIANAISSAAII